MWIGVDLDGTLAKTGGLDDTVIGEPIAPMVQRVRQWINEGKTVKIFTSRVYNNPQQVDIIKAWCLKHIGHTLDVTACKEPELVEFWDDRAVRVVKNKGIPANG